MNVNLAHPQELFAALGDPLRLRLTCCLTAVEGGLCVCELVDALQVSQPNVSRHLKLMKTADLVEERREGRWVYVRLKDAKHPFFEQIRCCLETVCCCHDVQTDLKRLEARLKLRQSGKCVVGVQPRKRRANTPGKEASHVPVSMLRTVSV